MQFVVKRDILLKSLNFVQGVVEKKNTLPILSNVLIELKDKKLSIIATDLDIIFYDYFETKRSKIKKYFRGLSELSHLKQRNLSFHSFHSKKILVSRGRRPT